MLFENAKPFQLFVTVKRSTMLKMCWHLKENNRVERLVDYPNGSEVFILYLFKVHNANKESWGEGAVEREREQGKNSIRRCPIKMSVLGKEAGRKM